MDLRSIDLQGEISDNSESGSGQDSKSSEEPSWAPRFMKKARPPPPPPQDERPRQLRRREQPPLKTGAAQQAAAPPVFRPPAAVNTLQPKRVSQGTRKAAPSLAPTENWAASPSDARGGEEMQGGAPAAATAAAAAVACPQRMVDLNSLQRQETIAGAPPAAAMPPPTGPPLDLLQRLIGDYTELEAWNTRRSKELRAQETVSRDQETLLRAHRAQLQAQAAEYEAAAQAARARKEAAARGDVSALLHD
jgi:hypothetical protein